MSPKKVDCKKDDKNYDKSKSEKEKSSKEKSKSANESSKKDERKIDSKDRIKKEKKRSKKTAKSKERHADNEKKILKDKDPDKKPERKDTDDKPKDLATEIQKQKITVEIPKVDYKDEIEEGEVRTPEHDSLAKTPPLTPEMAIKNQDLQKSSEKKKTSRFSDNFEKNIVPEKSETKPLNRWDSGPPIKLDLRDHIRELREKRQEKPQEDNKIKVEIDSDRNIESKSEILVKLVDQNQNGNEDPEPGEIVSQTPPLVQPAIVKAESPVIEMFPKRTFKPVCSFLSDIEGSDVSLFSKLSSKSSGIGDLSPIRFEDESEKSSNFDIFASSPDSGHFADKLESEYEIFMKTVQAGKCEKLDELAEKIKEKKKEADVGKNKSKSGSFIEPKLGEFKSFPIKKDDDKRTFDIMQQVEKARDLIAENLITLEKGVVVQEIPLTIPLLDLKMKAVDEPSDNSDVESEASDTNSDTSSTSSSSESSSDSDSDDEGALPQGFSRLGGLINPLAPPMLSTSFTIKTPVVPDKPAAIFNLPKAQTTPAEHNNTPSSMSAIPTTPIKTVAASTLQITPPSVKSNATMLNTPSPFYSLTPSPMKKVPIIDPDQPKLTRFEMVPYRIYSLKQNEEVLHSITGTTTVVVPNYASTDTNKKENREKRRKTRSRSHSPNKKSRIDSKSTRSSRSPSRKRRMSPPRKRRSPRRKSRSRSPRRGKSHRSPVRFRKDKSMSPRNREPSNW